MITYLHVATVSIATRQIDKKKQKKKKIKLEYVGLSKLKRPETKIGMQLN